MMAVAECIQVSHEMVALIGACDADKARWPANPIMLGFDLGAQPMMRMRARANDHGGDAIVLVVAREACLRLFATNPQDGDYHLPTELRLIAHAILDCPAPMPIRATYRLGKSIELLCESFRLLGDDALVPAREDGALSLADARRLLEARRLIDERWNEKLTIDRIARACGLNRVKLNRGFREMFDCTVAVALAERRLEEASRMLRTTDRPISSIGYDSGYLNNASFARAFARRFGVSPSDYRAARIAA
jgi:AraC family transcriptional regulator, transcriptional activator of the genes for pyochelin and ferripyochelin receptors